MNQKSFVLAAILAATAFSVFATPLAYAQDAQVTPDNITTTTGDNITTTTGNNITTSTSSCRDECRAQCGYLRGIGGYALCRDTCIDDRCLNINNATSPCPPSSPSSPSSPSPPRLVPFE